MRGALYHVLVVALSTMFVAQAGCREPPTRGAGPEKENPAPESASLTPPLTSEDLAADLTMVYARTWETGKWVRITVSRKEGVTSASAETVWRKSSLMQERTYTLAFDDARLDKLLAPLRGAELPELVPEDGATPHCSIEVDTPGRTWSAGDFCAALTGQLASVWNAVTAQLHPRYFLARHLLEAGLHAESRLNAKDVYFYYVDGASLLGSGYGPAGEEHTGGQLEEAARAHEDERYVDAVVSARNALSSRLHLYEKGRMQGLIVELQTGAGGGQKVDE